MPGFRVVTDSTSDVPAAWVERYGIEVVPLKVLFGSETFRDRVDLTDEQFFARLATASQLPTTSAPSPGEFAAVYERLSREVDGVISIHIGGQLSGTVDAARNGAAAVEGFPVHVVDSKSVTMAAGFLCQVAAEQESVAAALAAVEARIPKQRIIALLDTLRYLQIGGRIGRAQAMIGGVLDLKPILGVSDGEIRPLDRVRTRSRAVARMVELLRDDFPIERLAILHAQAPEQAERIRAEIAPQLEGVEVVTGQIGCVLGTHTGPNALGFAYLTR